MKSRSPTKDDHILAGIILEGTRDGVAQILAEQRYKSYLAGLADANQASEREAWDLCATAVMATPLNQGCAEKHAEVAAKLADLFLAERRKRWPIETET